MTGISPILKTATAVVVLGGFVALPGCGDDDVYGFTYEDDGYYDLTDYRYDGTWYGYEDDVYPGWDYHYGWDRYSNWDRRHGWNRYKWDRYGWDRRDRWDRRRGWDRYGWDWRHGDNRLGRHGWGGRDGGGGWRYGRGRHR